MRELLGVLYVIRFLLCGTAFGIFLIKLDIFTNYSKNLVFGVGVCSTPFFIAFWDYIWCLFFPGIPIPVLLLSLPLLSGIYLILPSNRRELCRIWKNTKEFIKNIFFTGKTKYGITLCVVLSLFFTAILLFMAYGKNDFSIHIQQLFTQIVNKVSDSLLIKTVILLEFFLYIFFKKKIFNHKKFEALYKYLILLNTGLLTGILVSFCVQCADYNLFEHDRSHYELQARYFAEERDSISIDNYYDERYGTVFRDDHGPLWPVYIGDARMASLEKDDYFNPFTIDLAYYLATACCFGMMLLTTCILIGCRIEGMLALLIMCMYRYAWHFHILGSRDSFRIIGILMLSLYVLEICIRIFKRKGPHEKCLKKYEYFVIIFFCFLCMQGHGGNTYIMLGLFFAFGCMAVIKGMCLKELIGMSVSVLAGTILGMVKSITIYLETGKLSSSTIQVFEGTQVAENYRNLRKTSFAWAAVPDTYTYSDLLIIGIGLFGMFFFLKCLFKKWRRKEREVSNIEIFSLLTVGMLLPLTGLLNFLGYNASLSFILQLRYRLYFLMLFSIIGACLCEKVRKNKRWAELFGIVILISTLSLSNTLRYYLVRSAWLNNSVTNSYRQFAADMERFSEDGNIYVVDEEFAYYFYKNPKLLYAPVAREVIVAQTEEEIKNAIKNLDIKVIAFNPPDTWAYDYQLIPFYEYLQDESNAKKVTLISDSGDELCIYVLN